jgi:serine/threonine protein kinase
VQILNSRYRIVRLLGEGASGKVYLARDTLDRGRVWALKGVPAEEGPEAQALLVRELQVLQGLRHPALPQVQDAFVEAGTTWLVMERVQGPTLENIQTEAGGRLPEGEVLQYGVQLCEVLAYLHERQVLHRDLKPGNCMIGRNGRLRLVDFGIARHMNPSRPRDTHIYGTPGFCPPEQYRGQTSPASDVYALAATLYVLLTGADPETFKFQFPDVRTLQPSISALTAELLAQATRPQPGERPSLPDMHLGLQPRPGFWHRLWNMKR